MAGQQMCIRIQYYFEKRDLSLERRLLIAIVNGLPPFNGSDLILRRARGRIE